MSDRRRIADDELFAHFVTFSCHKRRRLVDEDQPKRMVLGQRNDQLRRQPARCIGFVIMPDHVHAIIWFPQTRQLSRFMQGWKRLSSFHIRQWYRQHNAVYFQQAEMGAKLWTPKYYSFELNSRRKLEYMHLNPVRAGLVKRPEDWRWSPVGPAVPAARDQKSHSVRDAFRRPAQPALRCSVSDAFRRPA